MAAKRRVAPQHPLSTKLADVRDRAKAGGLEFKTKHDGGTTWLWARVEPGDGKSVTVAVFDEYLNVGSQTHALHERFVPGVSVALAVESERLRSIVLGDDREEGLQPDKVAVLEDHLRTLGVSEWRVRCIRAVLSVATGCQP